MNNPPAVIGVLWVDKWQDSEVKCRNLMYGLGTDREKTLYICSKNQILVEGCFKYIFHNHRTSDKIYVGKLELNVLLALTGR